MKRFLIALLVAALAFPVAAGLAAEEKVVRIGEITSFTGDVLVRTKGEWMQLDQAPHPIFNTDKIVTKRGRAEARFAGGGVLRVDVDSSLSIIQKEEKEGLIFKKSINVRQINVLVGDIYFNVKVEKGSGLKYRVRSPSMTAAIRGSDGVLLVGPGGDSQYKTLSGDIGTSGQFAPHPNPMPKTGESMTVPPDKLPFATNRSNSDHLGMASQALQAQRQAGPGGSPGQVMKGRTHARLMAARETLGEARGFKENVAKAEQAVSAIEANANAINALGVKADQYRQMAEQAATPEQKAVYLSAAETADIAANAKVAESTAQMAVTLAVQSGDQRAINQAQESLSKVVAAAEKAESKVEQVDQLAASAGTATGEKAEALAAAADTVKTAAALDGAAANGYANAATQSMSGDSAAAAQSSRQALQAENASAAATSAVNRAVASAQQGNLAGAQSAQRAVQSSADTVQQPVGALPPVVEQPPVVEEAPVVVPLPVVEEAPTIVEPVDVPDPGDLPTASPVLPVQ